LLTPKDKELLYKILKYSKIIQEMIDLHQITKEKLFTDITSQYVLTVPLIQIGEFVTRLSKELKAEYALIEWHGVAGVRHRLVHGYDATDWEIISEIIFQDLPVFTNQIKKILTDHKNTP